MVKKILYGTLVLLAIAIVTGGSYAYYNVRDVNPNYNVDITLTAPANPILRVGVAKADITPEVPDRWTDVNNNAKYEPEIDTYEDLNGNGRFDGIWLAGFGSGRAANGINDNIWARAMVIDDGKNRIAVVSIDAIGFYNPDVIDVRKLIPADAGISYLVVSSTHSHEVPDLMGLWGEKDLKSGIDPQYKQLVKYRIAEAVAAACRSLQPAKLRFAEDLAGGADVVKDTRNPQVFDSAVRVMQAVNTSDNSTIGTIISMGNHPETIWSANLLITSDFPHYLRETVEKGIKAGDSSFIEGVGGMAIYVQGCVGGLMCTHPSLTVADPVTGDSIKDVSFAKVEAVGNTIGISALKALKNATEVENAGINLKAKSVYLELDNSNFLLAAALGIFNCGMSGWREIRSEIATWKIGPATFATIPGELYPEIANGGVQTPTEGDFGLTSPIESPSLREQMKTPYKFVFGLANDELGYIIPKSHWDEKAPHAFGRESAPYGEVNSIGPNTGAMLHKELSKLMSELP